MEETKTFGQRLIGNVSEGLNVLRSKPEELPTVSVSAQPAVQNRAENNKDSDSKLHAETIKSP